MQIPTLYGDALLTELCRKLLLILNPQLFVILFVISQFLEKLNNYNVTKIPSCIVSLFGVAKKCWSVCQHLCNTDIPWSVLTSLSHLRLLTWLSFGCYQV